MRRDPISSFALLSPEAFSPLSSFGDSSLSAAILGTPGPDITASLELTKTDMLNRFKAAGAKKLSACHTLSIPSVTAAGGWDIQELHDLAEVGEYKFGKPAHPGTGILSRTVQVKPKNGQLGIYYAGDVNYIFYGWANERCYEEYKDDWVQLFGEEWKEGWAEARILAWKTVWHGGGSLKEALAFFHYGYSGASPEAAEVNHLLAPLHFSSDPSNSAYPFGFTIHWEPIGHVLPGS